MGIIPQPSLSYKLHGCVLYSVLHACSVFPILVTIVDVYVVMLLFLCGKVTGISVFFFPFQCENHEEIVAVIAHELGHWKLNHTMYTFIAVQVFSCFSFAK
jgi:hypothetical protein